MFNEISDKFDIANHLLEEIDASRKQMSNEYIVCDKASDRILQAVIGPLLCIEEIANQEANIYRITENPIRYIMFAWYAAMNVSWAKSDYLRASSILSAMAYLCALLIALTLSKPLTPCIIVTVVYIAAYFIGATCYKMKVLAEILYLRLNNLDDESKPSTAKIYANYLSYCQFKKLGKIRSVAA